MKLAQLTGEIHVQTGSGNVRAHEISGAVRGGTGSGDVEMEETGAGDIDLHTGSGNITARGVNGAFRGEAGSGDITAEGTQSGSWDIQDRIRQRARSLAQQCRFRSSNLNQLGHSRYRRPSRDDGAGPSTRKPQVHSTARFAAEARCWPCVRALATYTWSSVQRSVALQASSRFLAGFAPFGMTRVRKPMFLKELISQGWQALMRDRMRSALTMLGIVWGLASVVLLLAYGQGLGGCVLQRFHEHGQQRDRLVAGANQHAGRRAKGRQSGQVRL